MVKLYKLTTQDGYTRKGEKNQCLWGEGVSHSGTGVGELCGPGYIHAYTSPLLAVLLNPIHADIYSPKLWECEGDIVKTDNGLKVGCVTLTTNVQLSLPIISLRQRVIFAILCVRAIGFKNNIWDGWADAYINNTSTAYAAYADAAAYAADAAYAAADAARAAAYAAYADAAAYAADAAAYAADAADAARAAADAARAAAYAAYTAYAAADAAYAAAYVARAAAYADAADAADAARAAADAARAAADAARADISLNLIFLAQKAISLGA